MYPRWLILPQKHHAQALLDFTNDWDTSNVENMEDMFQDASCYASKSSEKNSFDVVEKDSNEESVVDVEKPNNIILPDNN